MIEIITIKQFPITLAQFLKWSGVVISGSEAKEIVKAGIVLLNDELCLIPGRKLEPEDKVSVQTADGRLEYIVKSE